MHRPLKFVPEARFSLGLLALIAFALPILLGLASCQSSANNAVAGSEEPAAPPGVDTSLVLYPVSQIDTGDYSILQGYIDREGKQVVPFIYDFAWEFHGGLGKVTDVKSDKFGFVDGHGKLVIPCKFDYASDFSEGLALVEINGVKAYIRSDGQEAFRIPYRMAEDFHDGVAIVGRGEPLSMDKTFGLIDKQGTELVPPVYTSTRPFSEGVGLFQSNWKRAHFFDNQGKELFAGRHFTSATTFENGTATVCELVNGKEVWGFMNREGKIFQEVNVPGMSSLDALSEGRAAYRIGEFLEGKWGFVDAQGKVVLEPKYFHTSPFKHGVAKVSYDFGSWAVIDPNGKEIFHHPPMDHHFDSEFVDGLMAAENSKGMAGFVNRKGKWVIAPRFSRVEPFSHGLAQVSGDTSGYIDTLGHWVWIRPW